MTLLNMEPLTSLSAITTRRGSIRYSSHSTPTRVSKRSCLCRAQGQRQIRRDAMQERQHNKTEKLRVLRLISACVESNVSKDIASFPAQQVALDHKS